MTSVTKVTTDVLILDFGDGHYLVRRCNKQPHEVVATLSGYRCDCADWVFRKSKRGEDCAHIKIVYDQYQW